MTSIRILDRVWVPTYISVGTISFLLQDLFHPRTLPRPPAQSRLEHLPDELLFEICDLLRFDSFHCLSQCSRRLRDFCEDGFFKQRQELRVEFWKMLNPLQPFVSPPLHELSSLLQRDQFCEECLTLRFYNQGARVSKLEEKHYCFTCQSFHGIVLFNKCPVFAKSASCLGWTGQVRLCPHFTLDWYELVSTYFTRWAPPGKYKYPYFPCPTCEDDKTSYGTGLHYTYDGSKVILQHSRTLPRLSRHHLEMGNELYFDRVREFCNNAEYQYLCPHLRLDNPEVVRALTRALSRYCGLVTFKTYNKLNRRLYSVFNCGSCDCQIAVGLNRDIRPSSTCLTPKCPVLVVRQIVRIPYSQTPTREFLTKLDPATYGDDAFIRSPVSEGVSWCKTPDCATTRLGRREAMLLQDCW
ncbi:uncharacterized protein PG998_006793 [Apiospora kogelbergensis]